MHDDSDDGSYAYLSESSSEDDLLDTEFWESVEEEMADTSKKIVPYDKMKANFCHYVENASHNHEKLTPDMASAVELMKLMDDHGCSVKLYDRLMDWHINSLASKTKITSDKLFERLVARYNLKQCMPFERKVRLPFSGMEVVLPCHDAKAMIQCMLSNPNLTDNDYLFSRW